MINHDQGTTEVAFTIGTDGVPSGVTVTATSGSADLDEEAVECVKRWRYSPARVNGSAIAVQWRAKVAWKLPPQPAPVGFDSQAHRCSEAVASRKMPEGFTEIDVRFRVLANGSVSEAKVLKSSGEPDLDQALLACVSSWTYVPAKRNGSPISIYWGAKFKWTPQTGLAAFEELGRPHSCGIKWYPERELRDHVGGDVILRFTIDDRGNVQNIEVAQSSGHDGLDHAAVACAQTWHYLPAIQNGKPVAVFWSAQISWVAGEAIVAELGGADVAH
jgi:TonB family protein